MGGNKCRDDLPGKTRANTTTFSRMDARRRRRRRKPPQTITAGSRPQATSSRGNWSLLASVVHRRGLWKNSPPPDWVTTPDKGPAQLRHNRAAQAEVTTPYPAPRFPRAARYSGALWREETSGPGNREGDGAQQQQQPEQPQEQQPEQQRGKEEEGLVKNATRDNRGDGLKLSWI